jgi:hypothetical protein
MKDIYRKTKTAAKLHILPYFRVDEILKNLLVFTSVFLEEDCRGGLIFDYQISKYIVRLSRINE